PVALEKQVAILYVASKGKLDDVPTPRVSEFEAGFYIFLERERPKVLSEISTTKVLSDDAATGLDEAVDVFRKGFLA
ncbi:MAG: F0F1 ATP synthase subunit alpha, partial [Candidatus Limnocylindrus sp.]